MRKLPIILAAGVLAFASAALGQSSPAPAAAVAIKNFKFSSTPTTVPVGAEVVWKNLDGEIHTVTSIDGAFRSAALDQNDSFTFKFTRPGTYSYICSIHPQMKGQIIVK